MIGTINHIAIAVHDLGVAWHNGGNALCGGFAPKRLPKHGVKVVFIAASMVRLNYWNHWMINHHSKILEQNPDGAAPYMF